MKVSATHLQHLGAFRGKTVLFLNLNRLTRVEYLPEACFVPQVLLWEVRLWFPYTQRERRPRCGWSASGARAHLAWWAGGGGLSWGGCGGGCAEVQRGLLYQGPPGPGGWGWCGGPVLE